MTYSGGGAQLGNLTYTYDADGRHRASGGSLASVTLPAAVNGNSFNADNAMTGFNGATLSYDANGSLTNDGANTLPGMHAITSGRSLRSRCARRRLPLLGSA